MVNLFRIIAVAIVGLYAVAGLRGWELGGHERSQIPPSARTSPGGYRSFHFWHSGIHGGK